MLKLFSFDVYALFDWEATLSFVTHLVAMKYEILPNILDEPFSISTLLCDSVVVNRVYKGFPISFPNKDTLVDLIELHILDFDVIFLYDLVACLLCLY